VTTESRACLVGDDAVDAAMKAAPDQHIALGHWEPAISRGDMRRTLEAAAPLIAAAERDSIRREMDVSTRPARCAGCGTQLDRTALADLLDDAP
jgi:hypothetical protein